MPASATARAQPPATQDAPHDLAPSPPFATASPGADSDDWSLAGLAAPGALQPPALRLGGALGDEHKARSRAGELWSRLRDVSLFWRVFAVNAVILVAAGLGVELIAPRLDELDLIDVADVSLALLAMLIANGLLRARLFGPLERLAERMETTDVLSRGERLPVEGVAEVARLERVFNEMVERLEEERRQAGAYALRAQEAERKRLSQGLHDEVGQSMTAVLLQLKQLSATASPEQRKELASAQGVVKQSLEDVRRLARELRPELLDNFGLESALTHLANTVETNAHIKVHKHVDGDLPPLDRQAELVLYRVAQESLTNVARHANASEATLSVEHDGGWVVLQVTDDGRGFDRTQPEGGGLRGIRERALIVGGTASIRRSPQGGVAVCLRIPSSAS